MKVWDITLTCDHKVLVAAATVEEAIAIANRGAKSHGATVEPDPRPGEEPVEITLDKPGVVVWYPGPWSGDALAFDEEA